MDDDILGALALLLLIKKRKLQKQEKKKRVWSRQWLQKRREKGVACRQVRELKEEDPHTLRQWILLDHQQYQELLNMVTPLIEKKDTNMRQAVTAAQRLTLTLRYLTTGESYRSLSCQTTPENVRAITMAAVALHNFLIESSRDTYSPPDFIDREDTNMGRLQRGEMHQHAHAGVEKLHADEVGPSNQAKQVREQLKGYFNDEGQVHWQARMALHH
ncbi:hypothetical protein Pcinc_002457 [Petrolisthes cinctipes]|uniref:Nuclease HARBI1 n=1 Tax=Petrolisthes cinctipes TaxID=88211 RepID=A0AAE1L288_PETCI|nr:hypothetical protein Pcinc_002457 [Petrolisthes cinctipes]